MRERYLNSIKIALSVIGAVIGAGFITGREIMRFFYGGSPLLTGILTCAIFFIITLLLLSKECVLVERINRIATRVVCLLNVIIMASMLGATDSLFDEIFNIDKKLHIFSLLLLVGSAVICLRGINWVKKLNLILIPIMIVVLVVLILVFSTRYESDYFIKPHLINALSYVFLNCFLAQPFIKKLKEENDNFSPFLSSLIVSITLSVLLILYLLALTDDCIICDIPILCIITNSVFARVIATVIIFIAIFSTQISAYYPIIHTFFNKNKVNMIWIVIVSFVAFNISLMGFYNIVDQIYPLISVIASIYFAVISILAIIFPIIKRKYTSVKRVRTKV